MAPTAALRTIFVCFATVTHIAFGTRARCQDSGTRVFSLGVWHGHWLDGFDVTCTGGEEFRIPPMLDEEGGGALEADICAGTAGVERIEWDETDPLEEFSGAGVVINVVITCSNGDTSRVLAAGRDFEGDIAVEGHTAACSEGQHVSGVEYDLVAPDRRLYTTSDSLTSYYADDATTTSDSLPSYYADDPTGEGDDDADVESDTDSHTGSAEDTTGDVNDEGFSYFISNIAVICSSATLDPICGATTCSDGTSPKEQQPEYCQLAECTQDECCEGNDSQREDIVTGVVSSVAAAVLVGAGAWAWKKFKRTT